ncbi:MAG: NlpC/P60 family protein [Ilumatobacteraceae bacterium]
MSRRPRSIALATLVAAGLLIAPQALDASVRADSVSDAQQALSQAQDELDNLSNQMGQLDEDYGAAQDQKTKLDEEIATSQAKVDQLTAKLGSVQQVLSDLAVEKFTTGGNSALSPLFSDAATYSAAEQKDALGSVVLDTGAANMDDLQSLVDDLAREQRNLQDKQQQAAALIATLEAKQAQYAQLEGAYKQKLADAEARYGAAQVEAEAERRAAAARAVAFASNGNGNGNTNGNDGAPSTTAPGRGGGNDNGGTDSGSGSGSGTTPTPTPPPVVPPVSGRAGVAVAAAYSAIGTPYGFAGETPGVKFDCSGLTKWAWGRAGVYLPHQSAAQYGVVPHVPRDQIQPGDLIFYYSPIGHVSIYVGGGMLIHAPNTGKTVTLAPVRWGKVVGIGRPG